MRYSESYLATRDVDWFCLSHNEWIMGSSATGIIPDSANDSMNLKIIQCIAFNLPDLYNDENLVYNEPLIQQERDREQDAIEAMEQYELPNELRDLYDAGQLREIFTPESFKDRFTQYFRRYARKGFRVFRREENPGIMNRYTFLVGAPAQHQDSSPDTQPQALQSHPRLQDIIPPASLDALLREMDLSELQKQSFETYFNKLRNLDSEQLEIKKREIEWVDNNTFIVNDLRPAPRKVPR